MNRQTWTKLTPDASPPARRGHSLAHDSARGKVVLFGGYSSSSAYLDDTWEWDGSTWKKLTPDASPPARMGHAVAYDSARGKIVLFGGHVNTNVFFDDTWEWDGATWTERAPASSPAARDAHALAYDSARGKIVLFAGASTSAARMHASRAARTTTTARKVPPASPRAVPPTRAVRMAVPLAPMLVTKRTPARMLGVTRIRSMATRPKRAPTPTTAAAPAAWRVAPPAAGTPRGRDWPWRWPAGGERADPARTTWPEPFPVETRATLS